MDIQVRCYVNCDDTFVAWKIDQAIPGLRGFALLRWRSGAQEFVPTWVGPAGSTAAPGEHRPSTEWPIQKFQWTDYLARAGDRVKYQVVPMTGDFGTAGLTPRHDLESPWTPEFTIGPSASKRISAYFNRGIVAAQWLARRLGPADVTLVDKARKLDRIVKTIHDPIRDFLGGPVRTRLIELLTQAAKDKVAVYAALYELDDVELIPALIALGKRAHVVLANGSVKRKGEDQNAATRGKLKGKVSLYDRFVSPVALGHNKFFVVCNKQGKPTSAWTGSTNWTMTGLCTQANNAVLIEDRRVAAEFKAQWDRLRSAGDGFPATLIVANSVPRKFTLDQSATTVWFTRTSDEQDLEQARTLINGAQKAILFLMFNPGPSGTLLNTIIERSSPTSPHYDRTLYIHGALNQDPSTSTHPVSLFHRGSVDEVPFEVVLPAAVNTQLAYWIPELLKKNRARAMVHSKVIVLDPFSAHPVVMTGSHNLGPKASRTNDENLVIIENHPALAAAYAVNIMSIYNQYRWRFRMLHPGTQPEWKGLEDNDQWQQGYLKGTKAREIDFWIGA